MPFISDEIYTNLTGEETVYLANWPETNRTNKTNNDILADMQLVRDIVEVGNRVRKENKIRVRQPLASVTISLSKNRNFIDKENQKNYNFIIGEELNVKRVTIRDSGQAGMTIGVGFDLNLTQDLIDEGIARDLIRQIQQLRKKQLLKPDAKVKLIVPAYPKQFEEMIKTKVNAEEIIIGENIEISSSWRPKADRI